MSLVTVIYVYWPSELNSVVGGCISATLILSSISDCLCISLKQFVWCVRSSSLKHCSKSIASSIAASLLLRITSKKTQVALSSSVKLEQLEHVNLREA